MSNSLQPHGLQHTTSLSFIVSRSLLKFISIEMVKPSNHLILSHLLLLSPLIFPSIRVFSNDLALCIRWPKYWSFSISPSKQYSGLISFRIDWLVCSPSVQGDILTEFNNIALVIKRVWCWHKNKRHKPMEQNWEPRNKPLHTRPINIWQGSQLYSMGKS